MATYVLTIGGTPKTLDVTKGELSLAPVLNGRDTLLFEITSHGAAYRATKRAEVTLTEDGTAIFGGFIEKVIEQGVFGSPSPDITQRCECVSYGILADRRFVTETIPAGTLEDALTVLVTYLTEFGVSLHGSQVTGPSLPELPFNNLKLAACLDQLSEATGYAWEIDPDKKLRMFLPGTDAAPFDIIDGEGKQEGDVEVEDADHEYANRVLVKAGQPGLVDIVQEFVADGIEDTFQLDLPIAGPFPYLTDSVVGYAVVDVNGYESIGGLTAVDLLWEYDPVALTITRRSGAPSAQTFQMRYQAQFPITVVAEDTGEQPPIWEIAYSEPNVYSKAVAQEIADQLLARALSEPQIVRYLTFEPGLKPGMTQTIEAASRGVNGDFVILEVRADSTSVPNALLRQVRAISTDKINPSFRQVYRDWLKDEEGAAAGFVAPAASTGGAPHPPQRGVQVFRDGRFFASDEVLNDFDGGGAQHGVTNIRSLLALTTNDDRHHLALINTTNGAAKAFTIQMIDGGDTLIAQDGGENVSLDVYGGGAISMASSQFTFAVDDYDVGYLRMRGLQQTVGLMPVCRRVTSAYTVDSTISSGGLPDFAVFGNGTFDVTLPALASATVLAGTVYRRLLIIGNVGSGVVTINPDGAETINGAATLALAAGQHVVLQALTGTDAGWYTVGSHGMASGTGDVVGPASSVEKEVALFDGTTGKLLERATGTGIARVTSGVWGTPGNVVESEITLADNTTNDVAITKHGFAPKAPNDSTKFLNGVGAWAVPPGGGTGAAETLDFLTHSDESATLTNSRQLLAGTGVTFDDSVANQRTINAGGGGSYTLIDEQTPTGTGTVTFSSLGSYTHLELRWTARGTDAAATVNMGIQFNGDTGSNYDRQQVSGVATTISGTEGIGATSALVGTLSAGGATAGQAGAGTIRLYDVVGSTLQKAGTADNTYRTTTSSGGTVVRTWGIGWRDASAITSLTLALSAGNFAAGSKLSLYGIE